MRLATANVKLAMSSQRLPWMKARHGEIEEHIMMPCAAVLTWSQSSWLVLAGRYYAYLWDKICAVKMCIQVGMATAHPACPCSTM